MLGTPLGFAAAIALAVVVATLFFLRGRTRILAGGAAALALLAIAGAATLPDGAIHAANGAETPAAALAEAQAAQDRGRWEDARRLYAEARLGFQVAGDKSAEAAAWAGIGDAERALGRVAEARTAYTTARALYEEVGGDVPTEHPLFGLELLLSADQSEFAKAREQFDAARTMLVAVQDPAGAAWVSLLRGKFEERAGDYPAARAAYGDAVAGYDAAKDEAGAGNSTFQLGRIAVFSGYPDDALRWLRRAHEAFAAVDDTEGAAVSLLLLGRTERLIGDYAASHLTLKASAETAPQDAMGIIGEAELGAAEALRLAGKPEEALAHYTRAGDAFNRMRDAVAMAETLAGAGRAYVALGKFDDAREQVNDALVLTRDPILRGLLSLYYADIELADQKAQRAAEIYGDAAEIFVRANLPIGEAAANARMATALLQAGEHMRVQEAVAAAEAALKRVENPFLAANRLLALGDYASFQFATPARAQAFAAEHPGANAEVQEFVRSINAAIATR